MASIFELYGLAKDGVVLCYRLHKLRQDKKDNVKYAEEISTYIRSIQQDLHELGYELGKDALPRTVVAQIKLEFETMRRHVTPIVTRINSGKKVLLKASEFAVSLERVKSQCHIIRARIETVRLHHHGTSYLVSFLALQKASEQIPASLEEVSSEVSSQNIGASASKVVKAVCSISDNVKTPALPTSASTTSVAFQASVDADARDYFEIILPDVIRMIRKSSRAGASSDYVRNVLILIDKLWDSWRLNPNEIEYFKVNGFPKTLGEGGMGAVYAATYNFKAHDQRDRKIKVAVKHVPVGCPGDESTKYKLLREVFLLLSLQSDCIIRTFGVCWPSSFPLGDEVEYSRKTVGPVNRNYNDDDDDISNRSSANRSDKLLIIMERMTCSLHDALTDPAIHFTDEMKLDILIDICEALTYLHARGIVHRDVKSQNVLLRLHRGELVGHAKLSDFGLSRVTNGDSEFSTKFQSLTLAAGTPAYSPPEMLRLAPNATARVRPSVDIWALGVIMIDLFGTKEGRAGSVGGSTAADHKNDYSAIRSGNLRSVAKLCLSEVASDRSSAAEVKDRLTYYRGDPSGEVVEPSCEGGSVALSRDSAEEAVRPSAVLSESEMSEKYALAHKLRTGDGVAKDEARAFEILKELSDAGHVKATNSVGFYYERGIGVGRDDAQAAAFYKKASDGGSAVAKHNLGNFYLDGKGVEKSSLEALRLFRESSDAGFADGTGMVGYCYRKGIGVEKDGGKAFELYKKASAAGSAFATTNVGNCYRRGIGVQKNLDAAIEWFERAVGKGYEPAKEFLAQAREEKKKQKPPKKWNIFGK